MALLSSRSLIVSAIAALLLLLAIAQNGQAQAVLPGVRITLTQPGLYAFAQQITPALVNSLLPMVAIPPMTGSQDGVTYNISNIALGNVTFGVPSVVLSADGGVIISVTDGVGSLTLDWAYTVPIVGGESGTADVSVTGIDFSVFVGFSQTNGYLIVKATNVALTLNKLDITLHGGASWLLNFFLKFLVPLLKGSIESAADNAITNMVNVNINALIQSYPLHGYPIPPANVTMIDISLVDGPTFTAAYVTNDIKGEFFLANSSARYPGQASPMPSMVSNNSMFQVIINQYVFNTAGWAFYKSGIVQHNITSKDIPAWIPFKLNTKDFMLFLPALFNNCPNCDMILQFQLSGAPLVNLSSAGAKGILTNVDTEMVVLVVDNKTNIARGVFALDVDLIMNLQLVISEALGVIEGQLYYTKFNATVAYSAIGQFDVSSLTFLLNMLFNSVLVPLANEYLADIGIPLPVLPGVTLTNPALSYFPGYMALTTDLKLTPS